MDSIKNKKIAVVDIGGTAIKSALWKNHELYDIFETETEAHLGGQFILNKIKSILKRHGKVDAIGISTAGQVDSQQGSIIYANNNIPEYTGMQIKSTLEEYFCVPVIVENDVNAAAIGEAVFGAGKDEASFICLTYGTGVGGAIVIDRKIYHGNTNSAAEMGAMIIHPEQRDIKVDLFSGCYEKYASTTALVDAMVKINPSLCSGRKIFDRLEDPLVKETLDKWIVEVSYGLISLIHIFNPNCIILGGGIMNQEYIVRKLREIISVQIMKNYRHVKIIKAQLGNEAGLYGIASLVIENL